MISSREFWKALEDLQCWQRDCLPGGDTPLSHDILIWLLKCRAEPRQVSDLYLSSRFSEPTVRRALSAFVDAGFIELQQGNDDHRNRIPRVTPKFDEVVQDYRQRLSAIAMLLQSID